MNKLLNIINERDVEIRRLKTQLPDGMEDCTIKFIECSRGHGRLTATNWVPHGCPTCYINILTAAIEVRMTECSCNLLPGAPDWCWKCGALQTALNKAKGNA